MKKSFIALAMISFIQLSLAGEYRWVDQVEPGWFQKPNDINPGRCVYVDLKTKKTTAVEDIKCKEENKLETKFEWFGRPYFFGDEDDKTNLFNAYFLEDSGGSCYEVDTKTGGEKYKVSAAYDTCLTLDVMWQDQKLPGPFTDIFEESEGGCYQVDTETSGERFRHRIPHINCRELKNLETKLVWKGKVVEAEYFGTEYDNEGLDGHCYEVDVETEGKKYMSVVHSDYDQCNPNHLLELLAQREEYHHGDRVKYYGKSGYRRGTSFGGSGRGKGRTKSSSTRR